MRTKICGHCHKKLSLSKFHRCASLKDGHMTICKECRKKYVSKGNKGYKKYRKYQNNYQNEYYHKHKNETWFKERLKNYRKEFEKNHPDYYKNLHTQNNKPSNFIYIFIINY